MENKEPGEVGGSKTPFQEACAGSRARRASGDELERKEDGSKL